MGPKRDFCGGGRLVELKPVVALFAVCAVAGGALALTYLSLEERIKGVLEAEISRAFSEIFPLATSFNPKDGYYEVLAGENLIGYAAITEGPGYGAAFGGPDIKLVFGIDPDNKTIVGVRVIIHGETPGLGSKITENWFLTQFEGRGLEELALQEEGGEIEAVTEATISSRTVVELVRGKLTEILELLPEG
jgi:electron transport complex protein RnfG